MSKDYSQMTTEELAEDQEQEGVTFLMYRNSEGLRVSHPVRIESLSKNPAPWFARVYSPDEVRKMVDKE